AELTPPTEAVAPEGGAVAAAPVAPTAAAPAPGPAPAPAAAVAPSPPSHRPPAELDLGTTVLPVLLRRYAPYLAGALVLAGAAVLLRRVLRRR
ncbi:MAG TPA: carbon monoxide dehydrogenase, partial [Oryzihumus sp.]|nr:carbon monoxide dehydrogenase [Oryzihumus sp.]